MKSYILALDQGTTGSRAILFDKECRIIATGQKNFSQIYPQNGWVEHDPQELWQSQQQAVEACLSESPVKPQEIAAIGIANQRETTLIWEKKSGKPIYNAIVWQCRRSASICEDLKEQGLADYIKQNTGLPLDAYFSATKIRWILDNVPGAQEKARQGELLFGTVDSWLLWNLTGGRAHLTDYTNASRTMLFNIRQKAWDENILKILDIPASLLPEVCDNSHIYGFTDIGGASIPIAGIAGDQQASLFGQGCFCQGDAKNTYGTGCFLLMNTGDKLCHSKNGLLTTIAFARNGQISYALEGSVFAAGSIVSWLKDALHLINDARETENCAQAVADNGGVYFVPAFNGLGAPYWDMYARGAILGLSGKTGKDHLVRAGLEAIAYQTWDIIKAIQKDSGLCLSSLRTDGGVSQNDFLMQFQSDILGIDVIRSAVTESTALGAAFFAGLEVGFWPDLDTLKEKQCPNRTFSPAMDPKQAQRLLKGWKKALRRSLHWEEI